MELYDKLLKPITEVNYLRAENVDRYRIIIRYFYQEHEKIHYWMFKEDIYDMISALPGYEDYTMENCQNDLQALCDWGNLVATQDTSVPNTLQEFKNKKFRYQLSEYTVVIERMTIDLEHLAVEGASLEPTLLERIRKQILQLLAVRDKSNMEVADWWRSLNDDFIGNFKEAVYLIVIIFSDKPVEKTLPPSLTIFQYGSLCDMGIDAGNR